MTFYTVLIDPTDNINYPALTTLLKRSGQYVEFPSGTFLVASDTSIDQWREMFESTLPRDTSLVIYESTLTNAELSRAPVEVSAFATQFTKAA